ncbi:RTA1-domain-containing protein, partial [Jaminaea rosea]
TDCVEVSSRCPVPALTYGYVPSEAASFAFIAVFGVCAISQLIQGLRRGTYTWMVAFFFGTAIEVVGYVVRLLMRFNVFDDSFFLVQLVAIIIAPSFIVGALDHIPKHLAQAFGAEMSPIRPALYVWIFVSIDVLGLLLQAAGGILSSSGAGPSGNKKLLDSGNHLLVAGIAVQIFQVLALGTATLALSVRLAIDVSRRIAELDGEKSLERPAFKALLIASATSYTAILARCTYR